MKRKAYYGAEIIHSSPESNVEHATSTNHESTSTQGASRRSKRLKHYTPARDASMNDHEPERPSNHRNLLRHTSVTRQEHQTMTSKTTAADRISLSQALPKRTSTSLELNHVSPSSKRVRVDRSDPRRTTLLSVSGVSVEAAAQRRALEAKQRIIQLANWRNNYNAKKRRHSLSSCGESDDMSDQMMLDRPIKRTRHKDSQRMLKRYQQSLANARGSGSESEARYGSSLGKRVLDEDYGQNAKRIRGC